MAAPDPKNAFWRLCWQQAGDIYGESALRIGTGRQAGGAPPGAGREAGGAPPGAGREAGGAPPGAGREAGGAPPVPEGVPRAGYREAHIGLAECHCLRQTANTGSWDQIMASS